MLDRVVGIDDKRRTQRHTGGFLTHPKLIDKGSCRVCKLPMIEAFQILVLATPAELAELIVRRTRKQHGVAVLKSLDSLA